jgi:Uncharacterised protein family (UPF0175)
MMAPSYHPSFSADLDGTVKSKSGAGAGAPPQEPFGTQSSICSQRQFWCYSQSVQVSLTIPDEVAVQIAACGKDLSRAALEALALEGFRSESLSEAEIRQMLGFETRTEVHAFLKAHSAWMHYTLEDAERDLATSRRVREQLTPESLAG